MSILTYMVAIIIGWIIGITSGVMHHSLATGIVGCIVWGLIMCVPAAAWIAWRHPRNDNDLDE